MSVQEHLEGTGNLKHYDPHVETQPSYKVLMLKHIISLKR